VLHVNVCQKLDSLVEKSLYTGEITSGILSEVDSDQPLAPLCSNLLVSVTFWITYFTGYLIQFIGDKTLDM